MEFEENSDDIELSDDCEEESISEKTNNEASKLPRQHRDVFIAGGAYTDCENLLKKYMSLKTSTFEDFVKLWKETKFAQIFNGRDSHAELMEFTEEALTIAKSFILPPHSQIKRIGGLYLMYGFYTQQPTKGFFRFRITPQEWSVILKFVENLKIHGFVDANYVFHKLCMEGAFLTVAISREFGLERNYRKYLMPWPDRDQELDPCKTFSLETLMGRVYRGSLKAAADKCRLRYNTIKKNLGAANQSKFQGVRGTEDLLDDIMQASLVTSVDGSCGSLTLVENSSNIGDERQRIRQKAFGNQATPQVAQSTLLNETASTSQPNVENVSSEDTSHEDNSDHGFEYLMKPPSMRNTRRLKQIKEQEEKKEVFKNAPGQKPRKVSYVEVTDMGAKKRGSKVKAAARGKDKREKESTDPVLQQEEAITGGGSQGLSLHELDIITSPVVLTKQKVTDVGAKKKGSKVKAAARGKDKGEKESTDPVLQQEEAITGGGSQGLSLQELDITTSPIVLTKQKGRKRKNAPASELVIAPQDSTTSDITGKTTKKKAPPRRSTNKAGKSVN